jgi:hypothetical protein
MKKYLVCSMILLFLLSFSAGATSIIEGRTLSVAGLYPDITIDSSADIVFTSAGVGGGGTLIYTANDLIITYASGDFDPLAGKVDFTLTMTINNLGQITSGSMEEEVVSAFTLQNVPGGPHSYAVGETVLSGPVTGMQWENSGGIGLFGFIIQPLSGEFVNDGFWPGAPATYIVGRSDEDPWPGPAWWNGGDFELNKAKANKAPTPEPSTILLLGFGLVGAAGYAWRRKKKQS